MTRCERCKRNYPNWLVQPLMTNDRTTMLDAVCALDEIRKIHGDPTLQFSGEQNQARYAETLKRRAGTKEGHDV